MSAPLKFAAIGTVLMIGTMLLSGCGRSGPEMGKVSGTITLNGAPVDSARVEFHPEQGSPSYGMTDKSGHYTMSFSNSLDGVFVGPCRVEIWTDETTKIDGQPVRGEVFPRKYNRDSELKMTVESGSNQFDFPCTNDKK